MRKVLKVLYKILCLTISLWVRHVSLTSCKGGEKKEQKFAAFMPSEARYFFFLSIWNETWKYRSKERRLEEFVIERHNFTPHECLENVNIVNLHFQWSRVKALSCFNAPHRANSNFSFRKSSLQWSCSVNGHDEDFTHNSLKHVQGYMYICIYVCTNFLS